MANKTSSKNILLVDDDEHVLFTHQLFLEQMSYNVAVASNGLEALTAFRREPDRYDMVVTDYQMPEMDGLRLVAEIRKCRRDIPILLVSGNADDVLINRLNEYDVLVANKPVMFDTFEGLMKRSFLLSAEAPASHCSNSQPASFCNALSI